MIVKLSRLFIVFIVIIVASVTLPELYKISFRERVIAPMVYFSPVSDDFLIGDANKKEYIFRDSSGKKYSRDEADLLLPLTNYRILLAKGNMPDSVRSRRIDIDTLRRNNLYMRLKPKEIERPAIKLFPLFESRPARFKLTMPENFFSINAQMEFIDAATNTTQQDLTESFTKALQEKGFAFPGEKYFGNPTIRKAFDEGYFVVDHNQKLFQIKKIKGKPFCKNVPLPDGFIVKHMLVYENALREFYGVIINDKNEIYLLFYDNYKLQQLPVELYNASEDNFTFRGNIFFRQVNVVKENKSITYVMDRQYKLIAKYEEDIPARYGVTINWIKKVIFPFSLSLNKSTTYYFGLYFSAYSVYALFLNVLLMLGMLLFKRYRGNAFIKKWYDFVLVLVTGIYGFIAVLVYENTDL